MRERKERENINPRLAAVSLSYRCDGYPLLIGSHPGSDNDQRVYIVCGSNGYKGADLPPTQPWNLPAALLVCVTGPLF